MITLTWLYALGGAMFAAFALLGARDRSNPKRWGNAAFSSLLALSFFAGSALGDLGNGVLMLCLVALAGFGQAPQEPRRGGRIARAVGFEHAAAQAGHA